MDIELEKVSFHSNPKRKAVLKQCSNYQTVVLISNTSKVMLKILQARLQKYLNWELQMYTLGLRKGRGTRDQIANIRWIIENVREFQRNIYLCFIDYAKAFDCVGHNKLENSKEMGTPTTLPVSWEIFMQVKNQQLKLDMNQLTGQNWKEYIKAVYCHPAYFTYIFSMSCKMLGGMNYKMESKLPGETSAISNMQIIQV